MCRTYQSLWALPNKSPHDRTLMQRASKPNIRPIIPKQSPTPLFHAILSPSVTPVRRYYLPAELPNRSSVMQAFHRVAVHPNYASSIGSPGWSPLLSSPLLSSHLVHAASSTLAEVPHMALRWLLLRLRLLLHEVIPITGPRTHYITRRGVTSPG